jgi:hypothetical protein
MKVPLIPFQRPVPAVLSKAVSKAGTTTTTRKPVMPKAKFQVFNVEDISKKPKGVQALWHLLSKMDPTGDLWTDDKAIVAVDGATAKGAPKRTIAALGLTDEEKEMVEGFAIVDGPEPDNVEKATGVIFTPYQIVEIAFALGVKFESDRLTGAMAAAVPSDDDDDEEASEEEEVEEVAEESDEDIADEDLDDDDDDDDDE